MDELQSFKSLSGYMRKLCKFLEHHFILNGIEAESTPVFRLILTKARQALVETMEGTVCSDSGVPPQSFAV